jgi:O-antigen/teichoic acid export membrane protein
MIAGACIVAMAFGPEIIRIFASSEYYEARWVIPPVAASLYFMFLFPLYCNIEFYYEETKYIMATSCVAAIVNVMLNYFAIQVFGYIAAAYTTLICYILLAVVHYYVHLWILDRHGHKSKIYNTRFFVLLSVVLLLVMGGMILFYDSIVVRFILVLLMVAMVFIRKKWIIEKFNDFMKERKR